MKPVIMLGDANVDMLIHTPERVSGDAKPAIRPPELHGGGTVANAAVALARLDVPVAFVGMIGDDGYGRFVQADLAGEGIDTRGLVVDRDVFTPMVLALVYPNGERLLVIWPPEGGAHTHLHPDDLDPAMIRGAGWLHTSGMCLRADPLREAVLHGMQLAHDAGVPVSLDLNLRLELWGWGDRIRATLDRALPLTDVLMGAGAEEIVPLAGAETVPDAARTLAGGVRTVVARRGADGALAATPAGDLVAQPGFPVVVVDTLGAGDAFNGGFIAARAAGHDVAEALRWGNAVAALKITRQGARGVPSRTEVERLLQSQ